MSLILVDTGPLYALAIASDQYHLQARTELELIAEEQSSIVVAFTTIVETHRLLLRRTSPRFASEWFLTLYDRTQLLNLTDDDYLNAMELIRSYDDQSITLADAVLAVLSGRLGIPVWTYDHHFDILRVARWR